MKPIFASQLDASCACLARRNSSAERHQASVAWRRQTVALKSAEIYASLLSSHEMQWSTRRGGVLMANDHRIRPSGRAAGSGEGDQDSPFSSARGTVLRVFIWCPLCYPVYVPISFRGRTLASSRAVSRIAMFAMWENRRKQTRLPRVVFPSLFLQSLFLLWKYSTSTWKLEQVVTRFRHWFFNF